jgi:hypothetical protein
MKKRIFRYVKHISLTLLFLGTSVIVFGLYHGASMHYADNPKMMDWDNDGPYVFYENDSILNVNYIKGNQDDGFYLEQKDYSVNSKIPAFCHFPLDSTSFEFSINTNTKSPLNTYDDNSKILAISDIESGYRTFRDFLINNKVIDKKLNWIFENGHLVLVGDFVDRGFSTTQVLWFIYKLEQDAIKKGGFVHFILGNHELKNMQGNYDSSSPKYYHIASILEKQQSQLYDSNSFIGKWMASKNTVELINGILFTHGGIHPNIVDYNLSIDEVNEIVSSNYYHPYYPRPEKTKEQFLNSTHTGVSWYRGYFKDDLIQEDIDLGLQKFNAKAVVVGHTLQSKVNRQFNGKVIGIDVKHPKDYHKNFPNSESEGLLIEKGKYYRVLHDGKKVEI